MIDFSLIFESIPQLLKGALVTLQIALYSCGIGLIFGTVLGIAQRSYYSFFRIISSFYVIIFRGTPMLIQILFITYVLPQLNLGISLAPFWAAVCAIGLNSSAYISQIIKSGIASVSKGQIEAARTLGLTGFQITRYIVLPQAIRVTIPALGNELITLVKDSSLASIIGVYELTKEGSIIRSLTADALSTYSAVACIYLVITTTLSLVINYFEKRVNHHVRA